MATARRRTLAPTVRSLGTPAAPPGLVPLHGAAAAVLGGAHPGVRSQLAGARPLAEVRALEAPLSVAERLALIDQALVLLELNYVHRPLKEAMHAVRPVQRLKLLRQRIEATPEDAQEPAWGFHQEMLDIFTSVRDLHTNYILPDPFQRMTAFLPFLVETYVEDGERRYLVTHVVGGFDRPPFAQGVRIVAWNGVPVERAVELNAERFAGSNPEARRARGIERLTVRPLITSMPPDEDWVIVTYETGDGQTHELRVDWLVLDAVEVAELLDASRLALDMASGLGIDVDAEAAGQAKKILYAPGAVVAEARMAAGEPAAEDAPASESRRPEMTAEIIDTPSGRFGYLRIWTFASRIPDEPFEDFLNGFVGEVARLLEVLPDDGLILDVRGNGGGVILAGEMLLQLMTPRRIEPERLQFINSPLNLEIAKRWGPASGLDLSPWAPSIAQSVQTGAVWSRAFPLTPDDAANAIGQRYCGPVVLITDARCYSTTDIFAAGFQDHGIGPVLGVDRNTGAGGANVWGHDLLSLLMEGAPSNPYRALPRGVRMRVAMRRNLRVGPLSGTPLEDLGVVPDVDHPLTRNDLLNGNVDLLDHAAALLASQPRRRLVAERVGGAAGGVVRLRITTAGIDRLDVAVRDRPQGSLDWADGTTEIEIDLAPPADLLLRGYASGTLVVARRLALEA
ncbi:MAG TPA: S41 family peptidase [Geminicoccaceae bacterium]